MKLPWDFIEGRDKPTPGFSPAQSCEVGIALGAELARFCDAQHAKTGRDTRCLDCAFRLGTLPNENVETLANAVKCLFENDTFLCHVNRGTVCGGYAMLRKPSRQIGTVA